ncbi:triose phosphate/phosphate translocator, chloroplastic-like [Haliotis rubra]|uniref:triose phosphate/phosphate translocator, chloroplastic-like n=1 Tax=Haliotis rubra TaxID=36100 RepID=UPI001EE5FE8C|nr:triose phosphate/phosphate translocator, chloroplastic-like [Haliotis rubra]
MFDCSTEKWTFIFGSATFIGWAVTSFLCHQSTYLFLGTSANVQDNGLLWASIITLCQVTMCCLLTDLRLWRPRSTEAKKIIWVKLSCHALATMATNYSMTMVHASSTFAIKLLEPVTSAIIQRLALGTPVPPSAYITLPIIIGGAVGFCGNSFNTPLTAAGIAVAFASNLILAFRNVAIKLEQKDTSTSNIQLRPKRFVFSIAASSTSSTPTSPPTSCFSTCL